MSPEYYDVLILMRDGTWGVRFGPCALSTAQEYARDLVEPPSYAKRNPFPKDRIRIRKHKPDEEDGVQINPVPDYYPKRLADTPEQQAEWDAEADRKCRPLSETLDRIVEVLNMVEPIEEYKPEEERPF